MQSPLEERGGSGVDAAPGSEPMGHAGGGSDSGWREQVLTALQPQLERAEYAVRNALLPRAAAAAGATAKAAASAAAGPFGLPLLPKLPPAASKEEGFATAAAATLQQVCSREPPAPHGLALCGVCPSS